MDFRLRNLKESKQNYNSLVEFPRTFDHSLYQSPDNSNGQPSSKIKQIEIGLNNMVQNMRRQKTNNESNIMNLQQRLEVLQYKLTIVERDNNRSSVKLQPFGTSRSTVNLHSNTSAPDLGLFKQTILNDLSSQKQEMRNQTMKFEQINMRQVRLQQELKDWINQQKQQVNMRLMSQTEELKGVEISKQRKYEYQYQNLKNTMMTLEHKIDEEMQKKLRNDSSIKQMLNKQISQVKQEILRQGRCQRQNSNKLMKDLKQAFSSLRDMMNTDRQNIKQAIKQIQFTSQSTMNKMGKAIESYNSNAIDRHDKLQKKIANFKDQWNNFRVAVNQKLEENKAIVMNVESNELDRMQSSKVGGNVKGQDIDDIKDQLAQWKKLTQQKNLNVFRQISNAIKVLRLEWRREHDELSKQFQQLSEVIAPLKKTLSKQLKKQMQQIVIIMNEQFDVLTKQMQNMNELLAIAKKQLDKKIISQIQQSVTLLKDTINKTENEQLKIIEDEINKVDKTLNQKINDLTQAVKSDIAGLDVSTSTKIQHLVSSMGQQSQSFTDELNKKIKVVKENIWKQVEELTISQDKKNKDLVDGLKLNISQQNVETAKKVNKQIQNVKKSIETEIVTVKANTTKQVSKVTDEMMALMSESNTKLKKQRENGENGLKQLIDQNKKVVALDLTNIKQQIEQKLKEFKNKNSQQQKKTTQLKNYVDQTNAKLSKNLEDEAAKNNKKIDGFIGNIKKDIATQVDKQRKISADQLAKMKADFELKLKLRDDKLLLQINGKKQLDQKIKQEQLKIRGAELDKKIGENSAKLKNQLFVQIGKQKTSHNEEINKIKTQIDLKVKGFQQLKGKKQAQAKAKEAEIKEKQAELKNKAADLDKKLEVSLAALKKDVQKYTTDEITKSKIQIQGKVTALNQLNSKKDADFDKKLQNTVVTIKKDIQKSITDEITKSKADSQLKLASINQANAKKQTDFDKKLQDKIIVIKKDMQKNITDQILKSKVELQAKLISVNQQKNKKQAELKSKQGQIDKKLQFLATTIKKDIFVETIKDKKSLTEEIAKVVQEVKKSKIETDNKLKSMNESQIKTNGDNQIKLDEVNKKADSLRVQLEKRMAELKGVTIASTKAQQAQTNKIQDQKLQNMKMQLSKQIQQRKVKLQDKINKIEIDSQSSRQTYLKNIGEVKQALNKLQVNVFSQRQKNKAVYNKMTSDILDIADTMTTVISQMKPSK